MGSFLQPAPPPYANDGEYIRMSDADVAKRLEDLKMFTRQTLNVEQRIEIAKQQQAMREAKKLAKEEMARNKEKARQEKNEKLEQQRKEKELKNQQAIEVSGVALFLSISLSLFSILLRSFEHINSFICIF